LKKGAGKRVKPDSCPNSSFNNVVYDRKKPTIHSGALQNSKSNEHPGSESVRQGKKTSLSVHGGSPGNYLPRYYRRAILHGGFCKNDLGGTEGGVHHRGERISHLLFPYCVKSHLAKGLKKRKMGRL